MDKISCSIVQDLLPLYADGVVSEETAKAVAAHIEGCEKCLEQYKILTKELSLPSNRGVQEENSRVLKDFKRSWKLKKFVIACVSVLFTAVAIFTAYEVFQNVSVVHEYFSPCTALTMRDIRTDGEWQRLKFDGAEHFSFDSVFYSKEVSNDANSSGDVILRISDDSGKVIIDEITVEAGKSVLLDKLERNTEYIFEIKADCEFVLLRIY